VQVIDSSRAIARRTRSILETEGVIHPTIHHPTTQEQLQVFCSGDPTAFRAIVSKILGYSPIVQRAL
jgi:glutamate racemase